MTLTTAQFVVLLLLAAVIIVVAIAVVRSALALRRELNNLADAHKSYLDDDPWPR